MMNKYLVSIRHFFEGYKTFEIEAVNKSDALMEVVKANEEMDRKKVIYMPNGKIVRV